MVAVCVGGRLRGYVHDDGKIIYTKLPYREPWLGEHWDADKSLQQLRLEELITTGYVPSNHYDDKPLSGREFFLHLQDDLHVNSSYVDLGMGTRLALVLHASIQNSATSLCDTRPHTTFTTQIPSCLEQSIRFQHFGCDFHIERNVTGAGSRLFECNKGPDMSVHSYRDGKMKRDVAADVLSFIGFSGTFDGSDAAAKKHHLRLIYDSETFQVDSAFATLNSLKDVDPSLPSSLDVVVDSRDSADEATHNIPSHSEL